MQAWNFGIQHEIKDTIFELRYVANHAVKAFRAFDYNQVIIKQNGFLDEFKRAQSNGRLALASTGVFDPRFNAAVAGSQRLPIFDQIANADLVVNATSLGLNRADPAPIPARLLAPHLMVYDTVYASGSTAFVASAIEAGTRAANGLSMLLHQGALAFEIWFDRAAPLETMRKALL